jgi:hypothetical protein
LLKQRKSDKYRLLEGRGTGRSIYYKSWIKIHEFPSEGRAHRILGWKTRRVYQLLSDLELYYFLIAQWSDNVIDIREQYPLLPLEETILIAENLGIKHSCIDNQSDKNVVMTTDFIITKKQGNLVYDIARTIKPVNKLNKKRTDEKFRIEEMFWKKRDISWGVVTDIEIPKTLAINLLWIYQDYFWAEEMGYSSSDMKILSKDFIKALIDNKKDIIKTAQFFDISNEWKSGTGLNLFGHLLLKKEILTDFNKRLNYRNMEIWFPKEGR